MLLEIEKTVVEGAGAVGLAALIEGPRALRRTQGRAWSSAAATSSRWCWPRSSSAAWSSRAGSRACASTSATCPARSPTSPRCSARLGANIDEVQHQRAFTSLSVERVQIEVVVQTRGVAHVAGDPRRRCAPRATTPSASADRSPPPREIQMRRRQLLLTPASLLLARDPLMAATRSPASIVRARGGRRGGACAGDGRGTSDVGAHGARLPGAHRGDRPARAALQQRDRDQPRRARDRRRRSTRERKARPRARAAARHPGAAQGQHRHRRPHEHHRRLARARRRARAARRATSSSACARPAP